MAEFEFVSAKVIDSCVEDLVRWLLKESDNYVDGGEVDFEKLAEIIRHIPSNVEVPEETWTNY